MDSPLIGKALSHFHIIEKVGAGGMGVVYRAHDEQLDRDVAIKVLPPGSFNDPTSRARLLREARTASKLNHPNICTIHEVGESEEQAFIAMEFVEGQTLGATLTSGALPVEQILRYGFHLADALAHAHERGVVHRDLKSANIVVTPEGRAKVLDFGLARCLSEADLTQTLTRTQDTTSLTGNIVGTLPYMAPEQLRGKPADARSDIWALGVVLYEMAAGTRPFQGKTGFDLSSAILNQAPPPFPPDKSAVSLSQLQSVIERCLEKEPGLRYQQAGEVRAALEAIQSAAATPTRPALNIAWSRRSWLAATAGLAMVIAVAAVVDVGGLRSRLLSGTAILKLHSLAVLPIENLSGDPEQEYFADGMTEALITDLSKIQALRVISRTSVTQYKGTKKTLPEISRTLKVKTVLTGSVIRESSRVRVTVQLYEAAADRQLWADSYEREISSILALQNEVARSVAGAIKVKLRPEEDTRLASARAVNPATYEAYRRGMYYLNKGEIKKGLAYLQEAVDTDPADPLANAGLALGYAELSHGAEAREDSLIRAKAAATTALKLDDTLAEALAARAIVEGYYEWNWDDAFRDFDRALEINPSLSVAYYHRSWFHILFGRMKQAEEDQKKAVELDPFNPVQVSHLALLYGWEQKYEKATEQALKSIEMAPKFALAHAFLAMIYQYRGMHNEAIEAALKAGKLPGTWRWVLGPIYAAAGKEEEAKKLLAELNQQELTPWNAFWKSYICLALGDMDGAVRWLDYEPHHAWIPWITLIPALRADPSFPELKRRMNIPPVTLPGLS